jgi:exonuclease SbcC
MRPLKLDLQNFGPFAGKETVDFSSLDDIFLITGKTGSGKTTIFDALCFALYGEVPGSRGDHLLNLRSDYAGENAECFVSLEFLSGNKHYRIDRSPKQEKLKLRGTGSTTVNENSALYEIRAGDIICISSKKSEADEKIRELIGLDAEEFFRIVLLPQGEFAEFLRQNTTKRRQALGKLFPMEKAEKVRELAIEKAKQASVETQEVYRTLQEIGKRVNFDTLDEFREKAETALREARIRAAALAREAEELKKQLSARESEAALGERLERITAEATELEEQGKAVAEKEKKLSLSRKAQPLAHLVNREGEKQKQRAESGAAWEKALQEKKDAEAALEEAEKRDGEREELEGEIRLLRERRPLFEEMLSGEKRLEESVREAETLRLRTRELSSEIELLRKRFAEREKEIGDLEGQSRNTEENDALLEEAKNLMNRLTDLKRIAREAEALQGEEKNAAAIAEKLRDEWEGLSKRIPVQEDELRLLRHQKEAHENANMAAVLGLGLKHGEPCPVCGSRDHPLPAAAPPPLFGIEERIAHAEETLGEQRALGAGKNAELAARETEQKRAAEKIRGLLEAAGGPIPTAEEADKQHKAQVDMVNGLVKKQQAGRQGAYRLTELRREQEKLLRQTGDREKESAALTEKLKHLDYTIEELRQKHEKLLKESPFTGAGNSASDALAVLDRQLSGKERLVKEYREKREEAGKAFAASTGKEETSRLQRDDVQKQSREAEEALQKALASSPFKDAESLRQALLDIREESALEEEIGLWKDASVRLESQKTELLRNIDKVREEIQKSRAEAETEIKKRLPELKAEQEAAEAERDRAGGELASLERDAALLRETGSRYERLSEKSRRFTALADDLAGRNPKKTAFDSWLLGRYLEEVAAYATTRLERMSEGRYALLLDSFGAGGNRAKGLDLAVFDAYTGKCRPCATLSGGESFMASISLALGLADSIQNRSGGVRLDAVFIDEGFGSLDEASLDRALLILDELRDHRMVGLISHVGDMRSRIPSHIEVVKSGSGSRIRFGSPPT